jgi:hypothetical protein
MTEDAGEDLKKADTAEMRIIDEMRRMSFP